MLLALSREVRRAPRHVSVLMIHQLVHRRQVNPQHHEAADKDIPPGMSREVLAPGAPDSPLKDGPKRSAGCPFAVAEEPLCSRSVYSNYPESRRQDFIHRHTVGGRVRRTSSRGLCLLRLQRPTPSAALGVG